jgi:hypothetical protein
MEEAGGRCPCFVWKLSQINEKAFLRKMETGIITEHGSPELVRI